MDPYAVLGVAPGATQSDVDAAYRRRSRLHDPDRQQNETDRDAARRFHEELDAAYREVARAPTPAAAVAEPVATTPAARSASRAATRDDWIVVVVALVATYVLVQLPVALGLGLGGALVGLVAAAAVGVAAFRHVHGRRA